MGLRPALVPAACGGRVPPPGSGLSGSSPVPRPESRARNPSSPERRAEGRAPSTASRVAFSLSRRICSRRCFFATARRIRSDLLSIWEETRKTIVFVTHNAYEACFLADRILVMRNGAIQREFHAAEATQERVLSAALGLSGAVH